MDTRIRYTKVSLKDQIDPIFVWVISRGARKIEIVWKKAVILIKLRDDATCIKMTNYQHTHRGLQFITT